MNNLLRNTGIEVIGRVPWGTHFCQFYQTKEDLLDTLIPYFKEGLQNNEFCVWVTSEFLNTKEATSAMEKAVPLFSKYLKKGQMEIFPHTEWYLKGGQFEMKRVLNDWVNKHDKALMKGFSGTRVSGNPFWIDNKKDWDDFAEYEAEINKVVDQFKLLVLCTYPLEKCKSLEIIDVIQNHEFALIKRKGKWENIESAGHCKMEEALRKNEARYRQYVELTGQLAWTTNNKGLVTEDVPAWRKYTGQSYEEVMGTGWAKALHPQDVKKIVRIWRKAVKNKIPYEVEYRVKRHDGVYKHFLVRGVPIFKQDGQIGEWVGTCIDISTLKKTEEDLAKHTAKLESLNRSLQESLVKEKALLEGIGDCVAAVDKEGHFIALNKKTEKLFGWNANNMLGKSLFKSFQLADEHGKIIPKDFRPVHLALTTSQVIHGVYYLVKKNTQSIPLFITSAPVILNNNVVGAINIFRDVSRQMAINRAKDEFLSFASHSLRTPLSAIAWSLEQLTENTTGYSEKQIKCLERIHTQTQKMIQLTNDLLDATRMEFGILSYKYEEVNPCDIAAGVADDFKERMKEKQIKFNFDFDKKIKVYKTYSNAIYLILHNLLSNAVKFTPQNGQIGLSVLKNKKELILKVSDSGIGIPKPTQKKIFQKLYRGEDVKDKYEGSGLGLYIASGIINHMNGKIKVQSKPQKGTLFTVRLPFLDGLKTKEIDTINI